MATTHLPPKHSPSGGLPPWGGGGIWLQKLNLHPNGICIPSLSSIAPSMWSQHNYPQNSPPPPEEPPPRGSVDHPMADLFSRNIYDLGYPKGLKNGNFKFFCQISSSSRPFLLIFCQNFDFQKIDLYPFNFELSCSHQFLTENDPPYHFGKGRSILRC